MLIAYQQQVRRLLDDQQFAKFSDFDFRVYINQARRQVALDSEILRQPAELTMIVGTQIYTLSDITYVAAPTIIAGLDKPVFIRSAALKLPQGFSRITIRPWGFFENYEVNKLGDNTGAPRLLAQQLLGAGNGTLWFSPVPDALYIVRLYPVCLPADLTDDVSPEALPQPWQEAIPYYAAYLTYLTAGNKEGADSMWERYMTFQQRGNMQVRGTKLSQNYATFRPAATSEGR